MRFEYDENMEYGFIIDNENDYVILKGKTRESKKFLKMAVKLINEKFEEDLYIHESGMCPIVYRFEDEYENILKENLIK